MRTYIETCQKCSCQEQMVWEVPTDEWEEITEEQYNQLCLNCFDKMAEDKKMRYNLNLLYMRNGMLPR